MVTMAPGLLGAAAAVLAAVASLAAHVALNCPVQPVPSPPPPPTPPPNNLLQVTNRPERKIRVARPLFLPIRARA